MRTSLCLLKKGRRKRKVDKYQDLVKSDEFGESEEVQVVLVQESQSRGPQDDNFWHAYYGKDEDI